MCYMYVKKKYIILLWEMFWPARCSGGVTKVTRPDSTTPPLATLLLECRPHYGYCVYLPDSDIIDICHKYKLSFDSKWEKTK